jgi:type IV secretion system protein VirD4
MAAPGDRLGALRALYRPGGLRTLFLIDEMPILGYLRVLEDAFGLVRGYRVQVAGILQDLGQLKALYKDRWESFLANAGVIQGFAPNDLTTADWMSRRSGQTTVIAKSVGERSGANASGSRASDSASWNQVARPTFLTHELMGFEQGTGLLWLAGMADGVRFFAPPYWKIDQFRSPVAAPNPYYAGG